MPVNLLLPQVTRIPITGPAPYNTLVSISVDVEMGPQDVEIGHLSRYSMRAPTPFRLAGFDQRVAPIFDHSTAAWISTVGPAADGNWIYAVDSVTGAGFSPVDGGYYIDLAVAISPDDSPSGNCITVSGSVEAGDLVSVCYYYIRMQVTSWVLCYEPPVATPPSGRSSGLSGLLHSGLSPADLARNPPELFPRKTSAAEYRARLLAGKIPRPGAWSTSLPGQPGKGKGSACHCKD